MLIKDGYYMLDLAFVFDDSADFAYSGRGKHNGIWEAGKFVDTAQDFWLHYTHRDTYLTLNKPAPLPDYLSAGQSYHCLSQKAYELLVPNLRFWPEIQWVKVQALHPRWLRDGKREEHRVADYWWPKCKLGGLKEALDLKHAEYIAYGPHPVLRPPGKIVTKKVTHWVLDGRVVGDLDWFYGPHIEWFCSPRARALVEIHHLTGFKFTPVDLWNYET